MTDFNLGFKIAVTVCVAYMAIWGIVINAAPWRIAEIWQDRFLAGFGTLMLIGALVFVWGVL